MGESDFIREVIRDPRHPEKPPEPTITGYKLIREYDKPFTKEIVGELYSKANHNTVSLSIKRVDTNGQTAGPCISNIKVRRLCRKTI